MKRNIFIALAAFAICSSCSDSYYLPETEQDLAQLNSEYDDVKAKEADDEGEKIETLASEAEIQASMDMIRLLGNFGQMEVHIPLLPPVWKAILVVTCGESFG